MGDRVPLERFYTFQEDQEIAKIQISVRKDNNYMDSLIFRDRHDYVICKIQGDKQIGEWKTLVLGANESIAGVKATMCEKYVRGIGFFVWSQGMGLPELN